MATISGGLDSNHDRRPLGGDETTTESSGSPAAGKPAPGGSLKRKRPPSILVPAVLREVKNDAHFRSGEDGGFGDAVSSGDAGVGVSSVKGKKKFMEDAHRVVSCLDGSPSKGFFGVYDGHGGRKAAEFVAENLHRNIIEVLGVCSEKAAMAEAVKDGYLKTDKEFLDLEVGSGACCVTALIEGNTMIVSNLGDCRAVLCRAGVAEPLTKDHTAEQEDERKRIEDKGGYVEIHRGAWRVHGVLSVSRSIGDAHLKNWVIAEPDTKILSLTPDMEFLVLASDGLWGKVGSQEAVEVVLRSFLSVKKKHMPAEDLCKENNEEFSCVNLSSSPKMKRVSMVKHQKTNLSPSRQKKTSSNSENESPPSKMRRVSLFQRSTKTQTPFEDNKQSTPSNCLVTASKELVNLALSRGSWDDITVMVIDLNHFRGISTN